MKLDDFRSRMRAGWVVPTNIFPAYVVYEWVKTNRMSKKEFIYWMNNNTMHS